MLPCVSAPMAASTWLGSSALDVQADPEPTAKPRASSAARSASPSTYRHENVSDVGEPVHRVPDHVDVGDLGRDARAQRVDEPAARGVVLRPRRDRHLERDRGRERRGHAHAAREPPVLVLRPVGGATDPGPRRRAPRARRDRPSRPRPPRAGPRRRRRPRGRGSRPRPPAAGRPRSRAASCTASTGCSVPTSPFACCSAASATPGRVSAAENSCASTRPSPVDRRRSRGRPAKSAALQHRRALDGADDDVRPGPATPSGDGPDGARAARRCATGPGRPPASGRRPTRRSPPAHRPAASARDGPRRAAAAGPPSPGRGPPGTRCAPPAAAARGHRRPGRPAGQWRASQGPPPAVGGVTVGRAAHRGTVTP